MGYLFRTRPDEARWWAVLTAAEATWEFLTARLGVPFPAQQ